MFMEYPLSARHCAPLFMFILALVRSARHEGTVILEGIKQAQVTNFT